MKRLSRGWLAVACVIAGVGVGAVGAGVAAQTAQRSYLNTSLFPLTGQQEATFTASLDDEPGRAAVMVRLQFLDRSGAVRRTRDVVIGAGQSASLTVPGPGPVRAHAEIVDGAFSLAGRRVIVGGVEIHNIFTADLDSTCIPSVIPKNPGPD